MKKILVGIGTTIITISAFAQNKSITGLTTNEVNPLRPVALGEIVLPILFISFLIFMLITAVKYFLEFRIKNKLIEKGMAEQLSAYLLSNNEQEKKNDVAKWAILLCGIGVGLIITYLTAPIDIHSFAIMAFSLGLSYWAYFFYLKK